MKSDFQLITDFRDGNEYSFVILYDRYKSPIFQFCLKMLHDEDRAKDIFQDVFICVYQNIHSIKNPDSFKSWLYTITRNKCITAINKNKKYVPLEPDLYNSSESDPLDTLISNESSSLLLQSLEKISYDYKEIILLRDYNGLSYLEISQILNISESAVKSKLFKARLKLHKVVNNHDEIKMEQLK